MSERNHVRLAGCTPEPLLGYLKALGVLRLVATQPGGDPEAEGYWQGDQFWLVTGLSQAELLEFFLERYQPTPVLAPWNAGSGFWDSKAAGQALDRVEQSASPRLAPLRDAITVARRVVRQMAIKAPPKKEAKDTFLRLLRSNLPDVALEWLDAAAVVMEEGSRYAPVLGTGGNDGRLDFTANFMQRLDEVLPVSGAWSAAANGRKRSKGADRRASQGWLEEALFRTGSPPLLDAAMGQFNPGGVGGPNATTGFEGGSLVNPWEFLLMIEGSMVLAGAAARRFGEGTHPKAAFPFTVEAAAVGSGTLSDLEVGKARGELWLPLWTGSASYATVRHLFAEGRVQLGRRQARTGLDFARAVAALGVDQSIGEFQRYGFLVRSGLAYLAAPLGRVTVTEQLLVRLIDEIDPWLDSLRRAAGGSAPASVQRAARAIDRAIFTYCQQGSPRHLQDLLIALGRAQHEVGLSRKLQEQVRRPLHHLGEGWLEAADDGSSEFRIAAALASITDPPVRLHWEPLAEEKGRLVWTDPSRRGLDPAALVPALLAVLDRRLLEASQKGLENLPIRGRVTASLADLHRFIEGETDEDRLADLLRGLATLQWSDVKPRPAPFTAVPVLSRGYAILKLLFLPGPLRHSGMTDGVRVRPEEAILTRLRSGQGEAAMETALRRLRACGLSPLLRSGGPLPRITDPARLGAALLIPVTGERYLADLVLHSDLTERR